jgi:hypothetical protein
VSRLPFVQTLVLAIMPHYLLPRLCSTTDPTKQPAEKNANAPLHAQPARALSAKAVTVQRTAGVSKHSTRRVCSR